MKNIHGSCVDINGNGILILGSSGSGKSDLALRLIDDGACLVADDRCELHVDNNQLMAQSPKELENLLEIRGLGIVKLKSKKTTIKLIIRLEEHNKISRMPDIKMSQLFGVEIMEFSLYPFEASATVKTKMALDIALNKIKLYND